VVAFSHTGVRVRFTEPATAVEVVFLEDRAPREAPPLAQARLAEVRPVDTVLPVFDIPIDTPAPTAITVTPPKAQTPAATAAPATDVPLLVDGVEYVRAPAPRYPMAAKRARVQGTVLLRVLIDADGRPREVRVHRSSGSEQLDSAATDSVYHALFRPHRENGQARSAQVIIPIEFALHMRTASR
jgi:protein TonB